MAKKYILMINLGGPESLRDVKPFLLELFRDPYIIDIPGGKIARNILARIIVHFRSEKSTRNYQLIGGASPLLKITRKQADKLDALLGDEYDIRIAMRYSRPFIGEAIKEMEDGAELTVLPLYPQYSITTTGSAISEFGKQKAKKKKQFAKIKYIRDFYHHPAYISALTDMIAEYLPAGEFNKKTAHIIFSAHGLPIDIIEKGDPYLKQTQITFENICEKLPFECGKHLAFQSRTGPAKWLEPDSVNVIKNLASKGARTIGIVPISFVAENLETLYDQDIVLRQTAFASGIADYYRVPAFDGDGRFIKCLKQLVLENE